MIYYPIQMLLFCGYKNVPIIFIKRKYGEINIVPLCMLSIQ